MHADPDELLDTIRALALDLARICPDGAEKATRIAELAGQVRAVRLDRGAVEDAIATETADTDLSDLRVRSATETVLRQTRDAGD